MDFGDIKIGDGSSSEKKESADFDAVQSSEYLIQGGLVGREILEKVKNFAPPPKNEVVYGMYNNVNKRIFDRIQDFFIDHAKISIREKANFFHMLAVMLDAGLSMVKALKTLSVRSENQRFQRILNTLCYFCEHGSQLSNAMSRFENVFDDAEIGIVRSGEATGRLDIVLFKLSEQLTRRSDLSSKLWGAAIYPIAVLVVLMLVVLGMLLWVFPTLLSLLQEGGATEASLPLATRALLVLQNFILNYWWAIIFVLGGLYTFFLLYRSTETGAVKWDLIKLRLPVIGNMLRQVYVLRMVSMLGLLIDSGLSVLISIQITGNSIPNRIYKLKLQELINQVKKGGKISEGLNNSFFLFPYEVVQMLGVGEMSANLGNISQKIATQYDREIDATLKKLTAVFEPAMILVVGVFVAVLALAVMAPIFNLSNIVGV